MKRKFKMARNIVKSKKRRRYQKNTNTSTNQSTVYNTNKRKKVVSIFVYENELSLQDFAKESNIALIDIIKFFFNRKKILNVSSILNLTDVELICEQMNIKLEVNVTASNVDKLKKEGLQVLNFAELDKNKLEPRPPIITVMGHVDHGKTSLLDYIKKTSVVNKESGGITQHIAVYSAEWKKNKILFIDTPGHKAFASMRERGAQVTDIIVLVVAADDGVKPQTIEAIEHAKAANVPVIVAINKIDKPNADSKRTKQELSNYDLMPEEWGGSTIYVEISALKGTNVDILLDNIVSFAEMLELKAIKDDLATGVVLEAQLKQKIGNFATLIIQNGTLNLNDSVVFGNFFTKIRILTDEFGNPIKSASVGNICIAGSLVNLPSSGDYFKSYENDKLAKAAVSKSAHLIHKKPDHSSFSVLVTNYDGNNENHINVIIKSDVTGTASALKNHLQHIAYKEKIVRILRYNAGQITDDDVSLASASNALIIGFNTGCNKNVARLIEEKKIEVFYCSVIYDAENYLTNKIKASVEPVYTEVITGECEVRALFNLSSSNLLIAGCYMYKGFIDVSHPIKYYRNNELLYEGNILSLRHLKSTIKRTKPAQEFGIIIKDYSDYKEGDTIKGFYKKIKVG